MRISSSSFYLSLSSGLNDSLGRVQDLQQELASGHRISKYSDDAVGAAAALRLRSQESDWEAYQRSAEDASSALGTTDGALQTMSTVLRRVHDLSINAVNGALGDEERSAIAAEISDLRDQLKDVANTRHLGRAVFGGFGASAVTSVPDPLNPTGPPVWQ